MTFLLNYFIYSVIGALPAVLAGYSPINWRWWAACAPMWAGIAMHDYAKLL